MSERNYNFCPYCGKRIPKSNKYKPNFCCFCGIELLKKKEKSLEKVQCTICRNYVEPNRHLTIKCPFCGSLYHPTCVSSWLLKYNACPMCQNVFVFPNKTLS